MVYYEKTRSIDGFPMVFPWCSPSVYYEIPPYPLSAGRAGGNGAPGSLGDTHFGRTQGAVVDHVARPQRP